MTSLLRSKYYPQYSTLYKNAIFFQCLRKKTTLQIEQLEEESNSPVESIDEDALKYEKEIEQKRNKSRLKDSDRRFLFNENPYPGATRWHQGTLKYLRRLYGRYGEASGIDPAICWPVKDELNEALEYERVAYSYKIREVAEEALANKELKRQKTLEWQREMVKRVQGLEKAKQALFDKIKKKEDEALVAKERKERLIDEVRMHFGYTVDPKEEKFKEMLEKKEKEQKKAMKEEKKKQREEMMLTKLLSKKDKKPEQNETG